MRSARLSLAQTSSLPSSASKGQRFEFLEVESSGRGNQLDSSLLLSRPRTVATDANVVGQRNLFDAIAKYKFEFETFEGWYQLKAEELSSIRGAWDVLEHCYDSSLYKALATVYPEYDWIPFKFCKVPRNFWDDISNQIMYFRWLEKEFNIEHFGDWYNISSFQDTEKGGTPLKRMYGSFVNTLQVLYPMFEWQPWKNENPHKFWPDPQNQKQFLDWLGNQLGIERMEDWYLVEQKAIIDHGGRGLLNVNRNSLYKALKSAYPHYQWEPWRFPHLPRTSSLNEENAQQFFRWASDRLKLASPESVPSAADSRLTREWHQVTYRELRKIKARGLIHQCGGLEPFLKRYFPELVQLKKRSKLGKERFLSFKQTFVYSVLREILPDSEIAVNYQHPTLFYSKSKQKLQLDFFIPSLNIVLEYQGEQHYQWHFIFGSPESQRQRDREKRALCEEAGLTLIEIPYWWNDQPESLGATLLQRRPDLKTILPSHYLYADPIPLIKPKSNNTNPTREHS